MIAADGYILHSVSVGLFQQNRIIFLGPVLDAVTIGDAVAYAGDFDLSRLRLTGMSDTGKIVKEQEGNTGSQNQCDNQNDDYQCLYVFSDFPNRTYLSISKPSIHMIVNTNGIKERIDILHRCGRRNVTS